MYLKILVIAYYIDRFFGEFRIVRHPVVLMGDYIKWFEKHFYKDSIFRGSILSLLLISLVFGVSYSLDYLLSSTLTPLFRDIIEGVIASTTIASKMLYDLVKELIDSPYKIKYLVSRDTENLSSSDINKAGIESYAENLSDGVLAPLFYLLLFGIEGAFVYKAINTLDSMVGYHTKRYENFGKFSARLDDIANYIPARITAIFILLLMPKKRDFFKSLKRVSSFAKGHDSPNAGYPISAMALVLGLSLGGDTSYFGQIKAKPYFGDGSKRITTEDIKRALVFRDRFDIFMLFCLGVFLWG